MYRHVLFFLFFSTVQAIVWGQVSPECTNAIPICYNTPVNGGTNGYGSDDFNGAASSGCLEQTNTGAIESNSAWYRFRTNASGQLGFNIGHDASEDWDFALYQANDCNSLGEPVRCNFFDNRDENTFIGVGEDPSGDTDTLQYTDWLMVQPGQDYYLLINNFSDANSGFSIQFSGEIFNTNPYDALDCSIVNNLLGPPVAACSNETVLLDATTINALSYVWYQDIGNGYQEIIGETDAMFQPIQSAMYRVLVITTDEQIISEVQVAFLPPPTTNVIADEITCENEIGFDLSVKDVEALGGQDPSNYIVGYYLSQLDAEMGINELSKQYVTAQGVQTIYVRVSSIQNLNCFDASERFELNTIASPILGENQERYLCDDLMSITIGETILNDNYQYLWDTGETTPNITVSEPATYVLTATTSLDNVFCVRTRTFTVIRTQLPEISDVQVGEYGFSNTVTVVTNLDGDFEYRIDDGEFQSSAIFEGILPGNHTVYMRDLSGCGVDGEEIAVIGYLPYFSPNGDGINDYWHIMGIEHLNEPIVSIFDRYGKPLHVLNKDNPDWNGTQNGEQLPGSDYWFQLSFIDGNGNRVKAKFLKNHFSLRR
ncbi:T9SS type B sorting domain-containing protein [Croceitalea rosinachiae]|uniref:T9SS type B sorting domain-containing protein n=1 Tax=Croceitalea rosinachiae TaxID=3075596 RepID=A0ABU3AD40_9FLAO|nr:T9SS type B sorting domain-containing protein [Croceitalea sp. F388]MDT0608093.1 T9SS type B sorting domain-containing protein [Croceitalea sp. F388]